MKDLLNELDGIELQKREIAEIVKEKEKQMRNLEADFKQVQADLATSEKARKLTQNEKDELNEECQQLINIRFVNVCLVTY